MNFSIPPLFAYITSWLGCIAGVWAIFERAETVASKDAKSTISKYLQNIAIVQGENWLPTFTNIFDRVFGERHLSIHCFVRSSIASSVLVLVFTALWFSKEPSAAREMYDMGWRGPAAIGFIAALVNFLPDYISLLETRYLLRWFRKYHSYAFMGAIILIDFLLTTGIILIAYFLYSYGVLGLSIEIVLDHLVAGFKFDAAYGSLSPGIFIYSTYATSLWLWLFVVSSLLIRLFLRPLGGAINMAKKFLDLKEKPLRSLGFVSMLIVSIIYILAPFFI